MKRRSKILAIAMCGVMATSVTGFLTGCNKDDENHYSIWLYNGVDSAYYSDYNDNPVLKYLLQNKYADTEISFEFQVPAAGSQQSNYQTMISSGDFPTLMQSSVADPAPIMYDNGYILDLTDYVDRYMPNYKALLESNTELRDNTVFNINGKDRVLSINTLYENSQYVDFGGMCYRRDWIVDYGEPCAAQKTADGITEFTGGYGEQNDIDSWLDNVKFPSWYDAKMDWYKTDYPEWDGSDPVTISDWEWMFDIFEKAQAALGISDSYCVSMYYPGFTWAGGLCSCFGDGGIVWYADKDNNVKFGGTSESTKAYFTCLNNWYKEGWLDKEFNERTRASYYTIDSGAVTLGKVGIWCGFKGQLGGRLKSNDGYTKNMFVSGCAYPINDVYGNDECKYKVPRVMNIDTSVVGTGFYLMKGADSKNLGPLFTFLDNLYSKEGAALRTLGLSQEQLADSNDKSFYNNNGLGNGAYSVHSNGKYVLADKIKNDSGSLSIAASLNKFPGMELVSSVDFGYAYTLEHSLKTWIQYENKGRVWGSSAFLNMSTEDMKTAQNALTKVLAYMERYAFEYIKNDGKINSGWGTWCSDMSGFNVNKVSGVLQKYVDQYPIA